MSLLSKIKNKIPFMHKKQDNDSFSKHMMEANQNSYPKDFSVNNTQETEPMRFDVNHNENRNQDSYDTNSYEPRPPNVLHTNRHTPQSYAPPSANHNPYEQQQQQRHPSNDFGQQSKIPFEEPPPLSLNTDGNSPEMEKLDTVMIELRNIKAQNTQILSEIRIMQDRLRRAY
ncbi:MAG: hypothetical protein KAQ92_03720 [Candidatus Aenigmarchaeota archaeon]|nr:hypothetical protein [Candidatus Aenigmarchaeota archaeon]